ncbi:hypothetical protein [Thiolapillus sp.]|uniref:hypothetical protein n=1 Tax=Thiolapillus sp. TaxID=2017437 RepID=UPI003AF61324
MRDVKTRPLYHSGLRKPVNHPVVPVEPPRGGCGAVRKLSGMLRDRSPIQSQRVTPHLHQYIRLVHCGDSVQLDTLRLSRISDLNSNAIPGRAAYAIHRDYGVSKCKAYKASDNVSHFSFLSVLEKVRAVTAVTPLLGG